MFGQDLIAVSPRLEKKVEAISRGTLNLACRYERHANDFLSTDFLNNSKTYLAARLAFNIVQAVVIWRRWILFFRIDID